MNAKNSAMRIVEQAAAYHARVAGREMTPENWQELASWINEDPGHRRVLESMGDMSQSLRLLGRAAGETAVPDSVAGLVPMLEDAQGVAETFAGWRRQWQPIALAASLLVAVMFSVFYMVGRQEMPAPAAVVYQAAIAERKTVALADGSSVVLNADSRLSVAYSERERRLVLRHGEIFVDVATDTTRPFHVVIGGHVVTVTGTAFNIRFRNEPARVTVNTGQVAVTSTADSAPPVALHAGQQLVLEPDGIPVELSPEELKNSTTWRDGWQHFDGRSLEGVIKELNPYVEKRIVAASRRAAELKVAGSFNVDNSDALLTALESVLPITVTHKDEFVVIEYDAAPLQ